MSAEIAQRIAGQLEEMGLVVDLFLAYGWAFEVEDEAPSYVRQQVGFEEERAWATDHPRELRAATILEDGTEIRIFGHAPSSVEDLEIFRILPDAMELPISFEQLEEIMKEQG